MTKTVSCDSMSAIAKPNRNWPRPAADCLSSCLGWSGRVLVGIFAYAVSMSSYWRRHGLGLRQTLPAQYLTYTFCSIWHENDSASSPITSTHSQS